MKKNLTPNAFSDFFDKNLIKKVPNFQGGEIIAIFLIEGHPETTYTLIQKNSKFFLVEKVQVQDFDFSDTTLTATWEVKGEIESESKKFQDVLENELPY